jgi:hypothetical protein
VVACYECCRVSTCVNLMSYIHAGVAPKEAGSWREKVRCFSELPTLFWFCARDRLVSTAHIEVDGTKRMIDIIICCPCARESGFCGLSARVLGSDGTSKVSKRFFQSH